MNSYSAVKKSFFSKLTVLFVLLSIVGSMVLPIIINAQTPTPQWQDLAGSENVKRYHINFTPRPAMGDSIGNVGGDLVRLVPGVADILGPRKQGQSSLLLDDRYGTIVSGIDQQAKYISEIYKHIDSDELDPDEIYAISTNEAVSYYIKGSESDDNKPRFLGIAKKDRGFFVPGSQLIKASGDENSTDLNTERGFINALDTLHGKPKNTTYSDIVLADNIKEVLKDYTQQRDNLQNQIDEIQTRINELDTLEQEGKISESQTAERDDLLLQRGELLGKRDTIDKQITNANIKKKGDTISLAACDGWTSLFTPSCWATMIAIVANIGMKLVSYALSMVGLMFDYSIELAVNSAEFINRIDVVNPVWTFLRDLLNMTFIFVLVWIAIHIILQKGNYTLRGDVVRVVIVAILINFSLFAAKAMVDGSNLLTLQLYQATKSDTIAGEPGNISYRIMNTLGFPTIFNFNSIFADDNIRRTVPGCGDAIGAIITTAVFGSIFMLVLIFALLMVGVLFFTRMANIIYLFVTSPLWVWGHIMNGGIFSKIKDDWWKRMSVVLKFPVIFMLFIFVAIFVFTKLFGLNGGLSFMSLFCANEEGSFLKHLPLIFNFCLVIWIILAAVKYGRSTAAGGVDSAISNTVGGWANAASLGLASKLGAKAKQVGAKAGDMTLEGIKKAPKAAMYTAGKVGYGLGQVGKFAALPVAKMVNKRARSMAGDANRSAYVRNKAGKLAEFTNAPTIFGKTMKQHKEWWKTRRTGSAKDDTNRVIDNVEDANKPPEWKEGESEAEYKNRVREFSKKTAKTFLESSILSVQDPDHGDLSHETNIAEAAVNGIKIEMDPEDSTKIKSVKFNQTGMRDRIADAYTAHMPDGRLAKKGEPTHAYSPNRKNWLLNNAKREARQKAFKDQVSARVTSTGSKFKANTKDLASLKEQLKKSEEDLRKHPLSVDHIDVLLKDDPEKLKGILDPEVISALKNDITELEADIGYDEHHLAMATDPGAQADLQKEINKNKQKKKAKEDKIKSTKEKAIKTRETIQKKVNQLNSEIKKAEEKESGGGDKNKDKDKDKDKKSK